MTFFFFFFSFIFFLFFVFLWQSCCSEYWVIDSTNVKNGLKNLFLHTPPEKSVCIVESSLFFYKATAGKFVINGIFSGKCETSRTNTHTEQTQKHTHTHRHTHTKDKRYSFIINFIFHSHPFITRFILLMGDSKAEINRRLIESSEFLAQSDGGLVDSAPGYLEDLQKDLNRISNSVVELQQEVNRNYRIVSIYNIFPYVFFIHRWQHWKMIIPFKMN